MGGPSILRYASLQFCETLAVTVWLLLVHIWVGVFTKMVRDQA
jgi:hypothetical protein